MRTRKLGNTELELSVVGLGTWAMGGGGWSYGWGPQDDRDSIRTIHRALDLGVNWIDTAPVYGLGHAEEIVGKALKGIRHEVIVATKCGLVWDESGNITANLSQESVRREVEASLRRLQTDYIDLYQIHWPNPEEQIEEAWEEMTRFVEEGKVRYIGVSNFSVEQMERVMRIHPIASLQPPYSLLDREIEQQILPFCKEHNIGVIVYSPLANGLLTGKWSKERLAQLPPDDWRRTKSPKFQEPLFSKILGFVEDLKAIAAEHGRPVSQLAIAWTLRREEVTAAIVGARRPDQIEETAPAGDWSLDLETLARIETLLNRWKL